ncbi:MAG: VTT domain-containing protein [Bacteroidota bacterium]|nr:VTT domain-containing protein [Bacteroidota bacterium]
METIIEFLNNLINPEWIVQHGGLYIVALIVFIETGLFFGFFLPGDSLLFIAGMIIANTLSPFAMPVINLVFWIGLITTAGVLGNFLGYWFGKKSDSLLFKKDRWLFKRKYLLQAEAFYAKKGGGAIIVARFLPIIRTFAPIVAGMVKMNPTKFSFYNILGSFLWVTTIVSAGFLMGENAWVKDNLEKIVLGIVLITAGPVLLKLLIRKKKSNLQDPIVFNVANNKGRKQEIANG